MGWPQSTSKQFNLLNFEHLKSIRWAFIALCQKLLFAFIHSTMTLWIVIPFKNQETALKKFSLIAYFAGLLILSVSAHAADIKRKDTDPVWLTQARASIKANNYQLAIEQLQAVHEEQSADWNNLMGFSSRKKTPPDLEAAEKYYQAALKIDPNHKGALEYYGQLLVIKQDLTGAQALMSRLEKLCPYGCEELGDLKRAIEKSKNTK